MLYAFFFGFFNSTKNNLSPLTSHLLIYIVIIHPNLKVFFNSLILKNLVSPFMVCLPYQKNSILACSVAPVRGSAGIIVRRPRSTKFPIL